MHFCVFMVWAVVFFTGCLAPSAKEPRGVNSPMMQAYQTSLPPEKPNPFSLPLSPQSQAYALTGGVLVLMVLVLLKASQFKEK